MHPTLADGLAAGAVAAALGGIPSTAHALAARRDPLEATLAAGTLLLPRETRRSRLLAAAIPVHVGISLGWGVVLAVVLPRRGTTLWGPLAGLGIAAVDLVLVGRRFPRVRALPLLPQIADHLAYGAIAAAVIARRRTSS